METLFLNSVWDGRLGQMAFELRFPEMKIDIEKENKNKIPAEIARAYTSAMQIAQ